MNDIAETKETPQELIPTTEKLNNYAKSLRKAVLSQETNPAYTKFKGGFVYPVHQYVDDIFKQHYPVSHTEILGTHIAHNYWVIYDVRVKAYLTPYVYISEVGAGGARMQLPKTINDRLKDSTMSIAEVKPTDFIDIGNDYKSALSKAISNAKQRFGVCADITKKLIMSEEQVKQVHVLMKQIVDEHIINPRDKTKARELWNNANTPHDKLQLVMEYAEEFEVEIDVSFLKNNNI